MKGGYVGELYYKGIEELLRAYDYHVTTNDWSLPHDVALTDGQLTLDLFN
jgi:hypothetical protein